VHTTLEIQSSVNAQGSGKGGVEHCSWPLAAESLYSRVKEKHIQNPRTQTVTCALYIP
jgi:hypothetical protein